MDVNFEGLGNLEVKSLMIKKAKQLARWIKEDKENNDIYEMQKHIDCLKFLKKDYLDVIGA